MDSGPITQAIIFQLLFLVFLTMVNAFFAGAEMAVVVVTLILSYFTLVFGEPVPKRVALQKAEKFSLLCVTPVYYISVIMSPFIRLLSLSTNGFLHLIGMRSDSLEEEVSEEEIKALLEAGEENGVFNAIEKEMIASVFSFDDKKAKEVMTPRQDMVAIDISKFNDEYMDAVLQSKRSRIPVYDKTMDRIIGILPIKDYMIKAKERSFSDVNPEELLQKPYFVPENQKIDKLFQSMQKNKIRMAILVDEYGGVSGLVTLEDLVEEIVGDIWDEYEEIEVDITAVSPNTYHLTGNLPLYDLQETLHLTVESSCDTLSGFLIGQLGYFPAPSELPLSLTAAGAVFTITEINDRVITSATVELINEKTRGEN